jgi:hypothetical protein
MSLCLMGKFAAGAAPPHPRFVGMIPPHEPPAGAYLDALSPPSQAVTTLWTLSNTFILNTSQNSMIPKTHSRVQNRAGRPGERTERRWAAPRVPRHEVRGARPTAARGARPGPSRRAPPSPPPSNMGPPRPEWTTIHKQQQTNK